MLFVASSCSKETSESASDNNGISFRAVLGKQTASRAAEFTGTSWTNADNIVVNAYPVGVATAETSFTLTTTNGGTTWSYSPAYNQPGYVLRYYSIFPLDNVTGEVAGTADYSFDYAVAATADAQEDLIAASAATSKEEVSLEFNHLLSQVNFAVQGIEDVKIEIGQLAVNGVKSEGTYVFGAPGSWSSQKTPANYEYLPNGVATHANDFFEVDGTAADYSPAIAYMGNGGGTYTSDNALMLMPQAFEAETDGKFSFVFSLTVKDADGSDDERAKDVVETVNLCGLDVNTWEPGKRYVYVIDFTSYMQGGPIVFKVNVASWEDAEGSATNDIAQTVHVANVNATSVETAIAKHSSANTATGALKIFPIVVPDAISAEFTITRIYGFDAGDKIRIECKDATSAANVKLRMNGWTSSVADHIVTLTCTTPSAQVAAVAAAGGAADDSEIVTNIEAAIASLSASNAGPDLKDYTITVSDAISTQAEIATIAGTYVQGDRIRISCSSAENAGKIAVTAAGWDAPVVVGNDAFISYQ